MIKEQVKDFSWDFYSKLMILSYCLLQFIRWPLLPQFMDIYYHLLTAWGFIQAGGYSGWDFWQYAPAGRVHIYPAVLHIILAMLMKLGLSTVFLAKFFESALPIIFLIVLWYFIRSHYSEELAFFSIVTFSSSFSFYLSLINHLAATLALIFGMLSFSQLLQKNYMRSLVLLTICFYTHIGISWFFAFTFLIFGFFDQEHGKKYLIIFITALILSLPILCKQLSSLNAVSALGLNLNEKYLCQFKIFNYILALFGLALVFKMDLKYRLFLSLFLASLIFLIYPYRFFSAEGYLPIIFLCAVSLDTIYQRVKNKHLYLRRIFILAVVSMLFFSPTISMDKPEGQDNVSFKVSLFDSAFIGMLFAKGQTLWFPKEYLSAATLIKDNSTDADIIYSSLNLVGVILGSISGRATANALLPEIKAARYFNPYAVSRIVIFNRLDEQNFISRIVKDYNLTEIGENKIFIIYKNPYAQTKAQIQRAAVPFWAILSIALITIFLFWKSKNYLT